MPILVYWIWSFANCHVQRDLAPRREEFKPQHIWQDLKDHARLRFPTGVAALKYNILQKRSYLFVLFLFLPAIVLTGLTMSPSMNAVWPWMLDLFDGRQSARSVHFISQTILAYGTNGEPLPEADGVPIRVRNERQLGYKPAKYVMAVEAVASFPLYVRTTAAIGKMSRIMRGLRGFKIPLISIAPAYALRK